MRFMISAVHFEMQSFVRHPYDGRGSQQTSKSSFEDQTFDLVKVFHFGK